MLNTTLHVLLKPNEYLIDCSKLKTNTSKSRKQCKLKQISIKLI